MKEKYLEELKKLENVTDFEVSHYKADEILISLLNELEFYDIIEAYEKVGKWYA